MKTSLYYLLLLFFLSVSLIAMPGCSDDKQEPVIEPEEPEQPVNPEQPKEPVIEVTVTMKDASAAGLVTDTDGTPLAGVSISSGESSVASNDMGLFTFNRIARANERFRFTFRKDGYFTVTRSGEFKENLSLTVVMQRKNNGTNTATASFSSTAGNTLKADGMQVNIPAAALVTSDGKDYSGTVQADMLYLSPDNENFTTMMPGGDMAAVRTDESNATLISYGMTEVSLTDGSGNPLQLKDGKTSEMTFPIPESMKTNPPATIPLWYFNEEAGLWVEEGTATLKGTVYVGTVRHFSWHNLDVPEERVTIKGKITDCKGRPVSRVLVTVNQTSAITLSDGSYQVYVPANTPVTVTVKSEDYNHYSPPASVSVAGQPGGTTVDNVNLELPCTPVISGQITNSCSQLVGAYVWAEYTLNGKLVKTDPIWTTADGKFELRISSEASGKATLWVQTAAGDKMSREFTLTGKDLVISNLEICEKFDESTLTITVEGRSPIIVPWDSSKSSGILSENSLIIGAGTFLANIESFVGAGEYPGSISYINGTDIISFTSTTFVFEASDKGGYYITITGTGEAYDSSGATLKATITGKVYLGFLLEISAAENVARWSDTGIGKAIPEMPLPIDYLLKTNYRGYDARTAVLAYKEKSDKDYNSLKALLEKAGYKVVMVEVTDNDTGTKGIAYLKEDNYIVVSYNPQGDDEVSDEGSYKLVVYICEGYSKIKDLISSGGSSTNTRGFLPKRMP